MSQNRLEIKITQDVGARDIELKAMSLQAAQSFMVLFESITKIVELTPNNKNITIQITSGSAVVAAEGEPIEKAKQEFEKILNNQSSDRELVEQWRRIQNIFSRNGLQYEAHFYSKGQKTSIYEPLRQHQKLRAKSKTQKKFATELEFFTGKLIAVGGKKPNIHVEIDGKALPPIACTEVSATKAKNFLYQTIRFSAWVKGKDEAKRYVLCDSYWNETIYAEFKSKIHLLFSLEEVEMLKQLHYESRFYLDKKDYGTFRKFLRLFHHETTDINILKILLIVTQSVREQERLTAPISDLQSLFDKQLKPLLKKS